MQMESLTVVPTGTLGDCPAAVDRSRGILYVNPRVMGRLTPFQRRFVLLHEEGHWRLGTSSEEEADAYAFDRLAGTEHRSLRQSVESLEEILHEDNPTLPGRYEALLRRALEWDAAHGNPRAAAEPGVAGTRHRPPGGLRRHHTLSQADALLDQTYYAGEARCSRDAPTSSSTSWPGSWRHSTYCETTPRPP